MKILHVTQNYHPSVGGTQHTIKKLSEYFHAVYNDEVTVVTTNSLYGPNRRNFHKIEPSQETINGVLVKRMPFVKAHVKLIVFLSRLLKRLFKFPLPEFYIGLLAGPVSPAMKKALKTTGADVIGASSVHYLFADYPIWRKHISNPKPFVMYGALHLHDTKVLDMYFKRIEAADYYIANTEFERQFLVKHGISAEKIEVIGTATDILTKADFSVPDEALRAKYNTSPKDIIITYIGRQEAFKGLAVLLNAFSLLRPQFSNISLFVCGASGSYTEHVKNIASGNGRVRLFTNISELQKTEILRLTDILVLPSKEESFGVVFLEAWTFSKAVIGTDIGAVASLIEDGTDGLVFKTDDAKSLAEKIKTLILDEPLRTSLGKNGNKKLQANYTWDIIAKKYRDIYQSAINKFALQQARL